MTTSLPPLDPVPANYEAAMRELQTLLEQLESGQLALEQLFTSYQRGAALLQYCQQKLQAVEQQIQVLGPVGTSPWPAA